MGQSKNPKYLKVDCPKCKQSFNYYDSNFRPFCSERCKEIDLGLWFTEGYSVASKEEVSHEDLEQVIRNLEDKGEGHYDK